MKDSLTVLKVVQQNVISLIASEMRSLCPPTTRTFGSGESRPVLLGSIGTSSITGISSCFLDIGNPIKIHVNWKQQKIN